MLFRVYAFALRVFRVYAFALRVFRVYALGLRVFKLYAFDVACLLGLEMIASKSKIIPFRNVKNNANE